MTDGTEDSAQGWFSDLDPGDDERAATVVTDGRADHPADWPQLAVEEGYAASPADYYDQLHETTLQATEEAALELEQADDQQLIHAVRAMDDCETTANELAERVSEWAGTRFEKRGVGIEYAEWVAEREPSGPADERVVELARRVVDLRDEAAQQRRFVERTAPQVAPNLSALAGPVLAARLIGLAGGLEALAKSPSSTVQVLGAEDALFAHLQGSADPPKHGIIFTHEYVNGTRPEERGSAARALAGKLTIAARVDHYGDGLRPELQTELDGRIDRIRSRGGDDQ